MISKFFAVDVIKRCQKMSKIDSGRKFRHHFGTVGLGTLGLLISYTTLAGTDKGIMAQDPNGDGANVQEFPTVCMIGPTGVGKSSFGNLLLNKEKFKVEHSPKPGTLQSSWHKGKFLGKKQGQIIQVVDTIGLEADDIKDNVSILNVVKVIINLRSTSVLAMVVNGSNARAAPFFSIIDKYQSHVNEDILFNHVMFVFTHWSMDPKAIKKRNKKGISEKFVAKTFFEELKKNYPNIKAFQSVEKLPYIFIDCEEATDEDEDEDIKDYHLKQLEYFYGKAKTFPLLSISLRQIACNSYQNNVNVNVNVDNKNSSSNTESGCFGCYETVNVLLNGKNVSQRFAKDVTENDMVETKHGFSKVIYVYTGRGIPGEINYGLNMK